MSDVSSQPPFPAEPSTAFVELERRADLRAEQRRKADELNVRSRQEVTRRRDLRTVEAASRTAAFDPDDRDAAASARDFARRNVSRTVRVTAEQRLSAARRLVEAESALQWAGYAMARNGTWHLLDRPTADAAPVQGTIDSG